MARYGRTVVYKEVDVEIEIDDVLEFIDECDDDDELGQIRRKLGYGNKDVTSTNLYDDLKMSYLKEIFEKYSLDELKEIAKNKAIH